MPGSVPRPALSSDAFSAGAAVAAIASMAADEVPRAKPEINAGDEGH
jgi:hypothetical protein